MLLRTLLLFLLAGIFKLSQASESESLQWVLASPGIECASACMQMGRECDEEAWPSTSEAWDVVAQKTPGLLCKGSAPGGWRYNPAICTENWLLSPRGGVCFWLGGPGPRCQGGLEDFQSPISQRICPCREAEEMEQEAAASAVMFSLDALTVASRTRTVLAPSKVQETVSTRGFLPTGRFWLSPFLYARPSQLLVACTCPQKTDWCRFACLASQRTACCPASRFAVAKSAGLSFQWQVIAPR